MYTALNATSQTLREFLRIHLETDAQLASFFSSAESGNMGVHLTTPREMPGQSSHGLSVWLYQVVRDEQRLNAPPRRVSYDRIRRTPLPLRLRYLMAPVVEPSIETGTGTELEQIILGKVLQTFHDYPLLRGTALRGDFSGTAVELNVRLEPLDLEQLTRIWDALDRSYQLSVSYEVSVVEIESEREAEDVSPVDVFLPEVGLAVGRERPGP